MDHLAHGQLGDLVVHRARNVGDRHDPGRHVARRAVAPDLPPDALDQGAVELRPVGQAHEQHDPLIAVPFLADRERLDHLGDLLDLAIDLGGPDPHPARIEHRVRAAVDDQPVVGGQLDMVAVRPHAGEALEIGRRVAAAVGIVPKAHRHRGKRPGADQLSRLADHRLALLVPHLDRHAEPAGLQLAAPDRRDRVAEREARHDVGAAGDRGEVQVLLDAPVDEVEALRHQRRTGRENRAERRQIVGPAGLQPRLLEGIDVFGAGPEDADPILLGEIEQAVAVGMERRAVVQDQGRAGRERAHLPVPHHPAAGGEVEDPILRLEVGMQQQLLQMLEQGAAGAVHDRLGHAGGAGRVQNVDRVIERQLGERDRPGVRHHEVVVEDRIERPRRGRRLEERRHDHPLQAGQAGRDLGELGAHVDRLAVIAVAVDGDQDLGLDLAEPVEHALDAEVGRAGRPDRALRGDSQHGDDGLGRVRHDRGHPIARADAFARQRRGKLRDFLVQGAVAQLAPPPVLAPADDRGPVVAASEQILGEIELGADEPPGTRHPVAACQHLVARAARPDLGKAPQRRPEQLGMLDRPRPEPGVVRERLAVRLGDLPRERGHVGARDALLRRLPQRLIHGSSGGWRARRSGAWGVERSSLSPAAKMQAAAPRATDPVARIGTCLISCAVVC